MEGTPREREPADVILLRLHVALGRAGFLSEIKETSTRLWVNLPHLSATDPGLLITLAPDESDRLCYWFGSLRGSPIPICYAEPGQLGYACQAIREVLLITPDVALRGGASNGRRVVDLT